jgi:hypothetical protein
MAYFTGHNIIVAVQYKKDYKVSNLLSQMIDFKKVIIEFYGEK